MAVAQVSRVRGTRCSTLPALARYVRHRPKDTVLGGVVEVRRDSFFRELEEQGASHAPEDPTPAERRAAMTWAQHLKREFNIDIETCESCGGTVKIIACIEGPLVIKKILTHLERKDACGAARRLRPCRAPPQARLFG